MHLNGKQLELNAQEFIGEGVGKRVPVSTAQVFQVFKIFYPANKRQLQGMNKLTKGFTAGCGIVGRIED